jgi:hypothetical protein
MRPRRCPAREGQGSRRRGERKQRTVSLVASNPGGGQDAHGHAVRPSPRKRETMRKRAYVFNDRIGRAIRLPSLPPPAAIAGLVGGA